MIYLITLTFLLIFLSCSNPQTKPIDQMAPPIDCDRQYQNCLKGKKNNSYTKKFCEYDYDQCDLGNYGLE